MTLFSVKGRISTNIKSYMLTNNNAINNKIQMTPYDNDKKRTIKTIHTKSTTISSYNNRILNTTEH